MVHRPSNPARALTVALAVAFLATGSAPALAQHDPQQSMQQPAMPSHAQAMSPANRAYKAAMQRMDHDMAMDSTGDPDVDFARGMIPHHQGAIDMAKVVLEYGKDQQIRQLAEDIIAAQEREIAFLRSWLERRVGKAG